MNREIALGIFLLGTSIGFVLGAFMAAVHQSRIEEDRERMRRRYLK